MGLVMSGLASTLIGLLLGAMTFMCGVVACAEQPLRLHVSLSSHRLLLAQALPATVTLENTGHETVKVIVPHYGDLVFEYAREGKPDGGLEVFPDPFPGAEDIVALPPNRTVTREFQVQVGNGPVQKSQAGHYVIQVTYHTDDLGDLPDPQVVRARLTVSVEADFVMPEGPVREAYELYMKCEKAGVFQIPVAQSLVAKFPRTPYGRQALEELLREYVRRKEYQGVLAAAGSSDRSNMNEASRLLVAEAYAQTGNDKAALEWAEGLDNRGRDYIKMILDNRKRKPR